MVMTKSASPQFVPCRRVGDGSQQLAVVERLFQEIDGQRPEGLTGRGHVTMPGHHDDRDFASDFRTGEYFRFYALGAQKGV